MARLRGDHFLAAPYGGLPGIDHARSSSITPAPFRIHRAVFAALPGRTKTPGGFLNELPSAPPATANVACTVWVNAYLRINVPPDFLRTILLCQWPCGAARTWLRSRAKRPFSKSRKRRRLFPGHAVALWSHRRRRFFICTPCRPRSPKERNALPSPVAGRVGAVQKRDSFSNRW